MANLGIRHSHSQDLSGLLFCEPIWPDVRKS